MNAKRLPFTAAFNDGGDEGDRTPDLCNAIAALSQLSYVPVFDAKCSVHYAECGSLNLAKFALSVKDVGNP